MESKQSEAVRPLFEVNNILYEDQPPLSVSTSKQLKEYIPSGVAEWELGVDPIRLLVPTGHAFVDPLASYLSFDVQFDVASDVKSTGILPVLPANGSWASLFSQVACTHSSGVEIDRQTNAGVWEHIRSNYDQSQEYRDIHASHMYNQDTATVQVDGATLVTKSSDLASRHYFTRTTAVEPHHFHNVYPVETTTYGYYGLRTSEVSTNELTPHVVIPISQLIHCWNSEKLMPPQLASGQIIDLETFPKEVFFMIVGSSAAWPANSRVLIRNLRLNIMAYTMTDQIQRLMAEHSITQGLSWGWKAVHSIETSNTLQDFSMQISTALSRVDKVVIKSRNWNDVYGSLAAKTDSFSSNLQLSDLIIAQNPNDESDWPIKTRQGRLEAMQLQVGAMYIPSQPVQGIAKIYHATIEAFGSMRSDTKKGVPLAVHAGRLLDAEAAALKIKNYSACTAVGAIGIQTSPTLPEAGLSISPQRTAILNLSYYNSLGVQRLYNLFLTFSKSCELRADSIRVFS